MYNLNNIWFVPHINKNANNSILVLDRAATNFIINKSNELDKINDKYKLILLGLIYSLQPLGIGINKELKIKNVILILE